MVRQSSWSQSIQQTVGCTIVPERNLGCQASSRAIGPMLKNDSEKLATRCGCNGWVWKPFKGYSSQSQWYVYFSGWCFQYALDATCMSQYINPFQTTWLLAAIASHIVSPQPTQCYRTRSWPVIAQVEMDRDMICSIQGALLHNS